MKYREEVEKISLTDEQKKRIASAVDKTGKARRAERSRSIRRNLKGGFLSLALVLIVAAPVGIYFALPKNRADDPQITAPADPSGPGDDVGPQGPGDPSDPGGDIGAPQLPDGISGKIEYKPRYAAGESITITYRVIAGDTFTVEKDERGFTVFYELLSSAPYAQGKMTEYLYLVELTAEGEGEFFAGGLIFQTPKGYTEECTLYGYRPAEGPYSDGAIYASATSKDGAFSAYLYYLMEQGEITEEEYHDRLSEYWRQSGAVHEDLTVK